MPIRSIPPFHPRPPKRGSSRFSWGGDKINGKIKIGPVEIDLGTIAGLKALQERLPEIQEELKKRGAKVEAGGKVSILGQEFDLGDLTRGSSPASRRKTFDNESVRATRKAGQRAKKEVREPIIDVFEGKESLDLVVELPGIQEKQIQFKVEDRKFVLATSNLAKIQYRAELELPCGVASLKSKSFRNGVLKVSYSKKQEF